MTTTASVAVIGAGPAGLAISALLSAKGIAHVVYEKEQQAGGLFMRIHPQLTFISPAFFNHLPLLKNRHVDADNSMGAYRHYLREYIETFQPPLQLNTTIQQVSVKDGMYRLATSRGEIADYPVVIVAAGMASFPKPLPFAVPSQIEVQTGTAWRGADYYRGKRVLVVGSGTTALELSALLAGQCKVWLAMKHVNAIPLHVAGINLHWLIHVLELLPKVLYPALCRGDTREPPINKYIKGHIKQGLIKPVGAAVHFAGVQAIFSHGEPTQIDIVLNCTGYRYATDFLPADVQRYPNGVVVCRHNQSISHPGLFMLGYPCAGAIDSKYLRGIRRDARRIIKAEVFKRL